MRFFLFIGLLVCMFFAVFATKAQVKHNLTHAPVPSWARNSTVGPKEVDQLDVSEGYYYEKSEYQVNLQQQTKFYRNVKVLFDSNGAENAGQININYDPKYQQLILHELQILRGGQVIDKLDLNKFEVVATETDLSRFIYNGSYSAYFILDDLRKDDKILISYSLKGFNPVFEQKFFDRFYLQSYEPSGLSYVNYIVPTGRKLQFKMHNGAPEPKIEKTSEGQSYSWEVAGLPAVPYVSYAPYWYTTLQWGECTEYNSWAEIGQWAARINPIGTLTAGTELANLVDDFWTDVKGDKYNFLKKVTDFVQNDIRYMGVEMGEYSHRANTPEKVFTQRYGDCKDKSVLLATMLKRKGIDCSLVLANSYNYHGLDKRLPSPYLFNHMTVQVTINGRSQFIDPTITDQAGSIQKRYYPDYGSLLVINKPEKLVPSPEQKQGSINIVETYLLNDKGGAILQVRTEYKDAEAESIRSYFKSNARNQIQKSYLEYYQRVASTLKLKTPLEFVDDKIMNLVVVNEEYQIEKVGDEEKGQDKRVLGLFANHIKDRITEISSLEGEAPIAISYPLSLKYKIRVVNHGGLTYEPFEVDPEKFGRSSYYFGKKISATGDVLTIDYELNYYKPFIDGNEKEQYFNDFKDLNTLLYNGYYLQDDGTLMVDTKGGGTDIYFPLLFAIVAGITLFIILRYNKTKPSNLVRLSKNPKYGQIDGWLVVVGLFMLFSIIRIGYDVIDTYLIADANIWSAHLYIESISEFEYKMLLIVELIINAVCLVLMIYCAYLFFKKRDLFAQTFLFTAALLFVGTVLITAMLLIYKFNQFSDVSVSENIKSLFPLLIWGTYVFNSEKVKGTFVQPYEQGIVIDEEITYKPLLSQQEDAKEE